MANRFLTLVHASGHTLTSLGAMLRLDRSYLSNVGAGRRTLKLARAVKLARAMHVTPEVLLRAITPTKKRSATAQPAPQPPVAPRAA